MSLGWNTWLHPLHSGQGHGLGDGIAAAVDMKFLVNVTGVGANGFLGNFEAISDFFFEESLGQKFQYVLLA